MRTTWLGALVVFPAALLVAAAQPPASVTPAALVVPADRAGKARDIAKWSVTQQEFYRSARLGMEWLRRTNRPDGRFVYGFLPALCVPLEGDDYVRQAGATYALARAARYFGDDTATALARQALLTLLLETSVDPQDAQQRYTAAPPHLLSRPAANGALLLAIHELAAPAKDLLEQGDQLAGHLRRLQRADGAMVTETTESQGVDHAWETAGVALHGVSHSYKHRPGAWQLDMLTRARAYYVAQWQANKSLPLAVSHTPAYAEAYLVCKDPAFASAVFAFNDWLCTLQLTQTEQQRKHWDGGFPPWQQGRLQPAAPDIRSAACAESLAEACRVARAANDLGRYQRYGRALEQCLQFLLTLQYNTARTRHFVEEFRPAVSGAFFASHQDGNLRIDHTQHALSALIAYLECLDR
jgi:hypothetical protein